MVRIIGLAVLLTGCVTERQMTFFDPADAAPSVASQGRFEEMATSTNFNQGIVPFGDSRSAAFGMPSRICEIRGTSGTVTKDIFIDGGELDPDVILVGTHEDGWLAAEGGTLHVTDQWGEVLESYDVPGQILGGTATEDGYTLLVETADGCVIVVIHADGTMTIHEAEDEMCDPDTDIEATVDGVVVGGGTGIISVTPDGVGVVADGSQASSDPTTGIWYSGVVGQTDITAHMPGGETASIDFGVGVVDFAARGGQLVALTTDDKLVHLDGTTHLELAREPYLGILGMHRLQMNERGKTLVLNGNQTVQFYQLRLDRMADSPLNPDERFDGVGTAATSVAP